VLHDGDQEPDPQETGIQRYLMEAAIQGLVRVEDEDALGSSLNQLYATVWRALFADASLGGAAIDITEGRLLTRMDQLEDRAYQAMFELTVTVEYMTAEGDPFAPADA
jgi:hypothetical protein